METKYFYLSFMTLQFHLLLKSHLQVFLFSYLYTKIGKNIDNY